MLDPGLASYEEYRGRLIRAGTDARIWQAGSLRPTYDGTLAFGLPGGVLEAGNYEIRLDGRKASAGTQFEPISRVPLTVTSHADNVAP